MIKHLVPVVCLLLSMAPQAETISPIRLHVAPNGNDAWAGTLAAPNAEGTNGPLATLERARDVLREQRTPDTSAEVILREGVHALDKPLMLGAEDAKVCYRAAAGEVVRILGGKPIPEFESVTDPAIVERLDPAAREHVVQADLKALGVTDYGTAAGGGIALYFQGRTMSLSRWPNEGFVRIVQIKGGERFKVHGRTGDKIGKWTYEEDRPARWQAENDAWLHGYWFWDWSDQRHRVKAIDTENRIIEVEPPYHNYGYRKGQWYYAYNLLAEIDTPGEWYVDREAGILYFWPPAPPQPGDAVVSCLNQALVITDTSHTTFRGIQFEAFRGTAITVKGGKSNRIEGCTLRNIASAAVRVTGGQDHGVSNCHLYELGGSGITLSGGDAKTLTAGGHFADNNHIHHYAQWKLTYCAGIHLGGVGNRATHNLIHDAPHMAIGFGGNEHDIAFNEIHHVCLQSNDAGALYTGRQWTMRGTRVRHNFMHHITGFRDEGCMGVYLDDMYCGTTIQGNLFYRVTRAAMIGGGRDNVVDNNLFVECSRALHIDNRAQNWASYHVETTMKERLDKSPYQEPVWQARYPELLTLWEDEPAAPKGNRVSRNVFVGENWDAVQDGARPYVTFEDNLLNEDPHFVSRDWESRDALRPADFALHPASPAYAKGFQPLLLHEMGLRKPLP